MQGLILTILAAGALSWGGDTQSLEYTRRYHKIANPEGVCLVGLQHRYTRYLGSYVKFFNVDTNELQGPYLVTDVAAEKHRGIMEGNGLVADTSCPELVHQNGFIVILGQEEHTHPDALNFNLDGQLIPRVRERLALPHRVCSSNPEITCVRQVKEWVAKGE